MLSQKLSSRFHRHKLEIINEILTSIRVNPNITKYKLSYIVRTSYILLDSYIPELLIKEFITESNKQFLITGKGITYLEKFKELQSILE